MLLIHILLESVCAAAPGVILIAILWDAVKRKTRAGAAILLVLCCTLTNWALIASLYRGTLQHRPSFLVRHQTLEFGLIVPLLVALTGAGRYAHATCSGKGLRRFMLVNYICTGMALGLMSITLIEFLTNNCGRF